MASALPGEGSMGDFERQRRLGRLEAEVLYLSAFYQAVTFDDEDGTWVHIGQFPIGPLWNRPVVELLIDIPGGTPGYPQVALEWFWTDKGLRTHSGKTVAHFFTDGSSYADAEHLAKGWGHFCLHLDSWVPAPPSDLSKGHSLKSFLEVISLVFHSQLKV
jgi:hypothetical protein